MNAVTDDLSLLESMKTALGMAEWGSPKDAETILQEIIDEFHPKLTAAISIRQGGVKEWPVCETCNGTGNEGLHSICRDCDGVLSPAQELADKPSAVGVGDGVVEALERIKAIRYPSVETLYAHRAVIDYARDQAELALKAAQEGK